MIEPCAFCNQPARTLPSSKCVSCSNPNCELYLVVLSLKTWNIQVRYSLLEIKMEEMVEALQLVASRIMRHPQSGLHSIDKWEPEDSQVIVDAINWGKDG